MIFLNDSKITVKQIEKQLNDTCGPFSRSFVIRQQIGIVKSGILLRSKDNSWYNTNGQNDMKSNPVRDWYYLFASNTVPAVSNDKCDMVLDVFAGCEFFVADSNSLTSVEKWTETTWPFEAPENLAFYQGLRIKLDGINNFSNFVMTSNGEWANVATKAKFTSAENAVSSVDQVKDAFFCFYFLQENVFKWKGSLSVQLWSRIGDKLLLDEGERLHRVGAVVRYPNWIPNAALHTILFATSS